MIKEIMVYNNDVVRFGNKFCACFDSYKWGRSYDVIEDIEKISDIIATVDPKIIDIASMKEEACVIGECSTSNGETIDFVMKIDNKIYVVSCEDTYRGCCVDISITYNVETSEFEMDSDGYAIVCEKDEKIIDEYIDKRFLN